MVSEPLNLMASICVKLLGENQGLSLVDRIGNVARRAIGKQPVVYDYLFWPKGLLSLGLSEFINWEEGTRGLPSEFSTNIGGNALSALQAYFDKWLEKKGHSVKKIDDAVAGKALIKLFYLTGDTKYLKGIAAIYDYIAGLPSDIGGAFEYQSTKCVFADGAGQTAMFLSEYSRLMGDHEAYQLGMKQIRRYLDIASDYKSKLPYHAYRCIDNNTRVEKLGIVGWGRAVGWLLMGASQYPELRDYAVPLFDLAAECQRGDGLIPWCLSTVEGPTDTSATAMIMYAAIESGYIDQTFLSKAKCGLMKSMDEMGRVQGAQAECIGIGLYPQQYGHYSFGQGAALAALSRYHIVGRDISHR